MKSRTRYTTSRHLFWNGPGSFWVTTSGVIVVSHECLTQLQTARCLLFLPLVTCLSPQLLQSIHKGGFQWWSPHPTTVILPPPPRLFFLPLSQCMSQWASGNDLQQCCHNLDRLPVLLSVQTDRGCARQPWHLWAGSHNVTAASLKNQQTGTMSHFTRLPIIQWFWGWPNLLPNDECTGKHSSTYLLHFAFHTQTQK